MLTLLDGEAVVIDGARRLTAGPGLRVSAGALVETSAKTALVRFEGPEQATIDLGPDTRAMLAPATVASRGSRPPAVYLQQGSVKLTSHDGATVPGLVAPGLELLPFSGSAVVQVGQGDQAVFAEAGRLEVGERRAGSVLRVLNAGEFYSRADTRTGNITTRPTADWLKNVPRAFRDPLPLRAVAFRDKPFEARALPGPTYEQLAHWLGAEPYVRRDFVPRFTPLTRDAAFRRGLQSHLAAHPEWAVVLNPDR
ncbi:MAG: hypothetical protein Q7T97_17760 [Burkholderiaceae bacterium]|nr:hypothetical protein [Burkholderiaceae bacterium]